MAETGSKKIAPLKILLVDDDKVLCHAISKLMSRRGYIVSSKNGAKEAIKALKVSSYDILITDLKMPEMNGIELLEVATNISPTMVKIVMTGYGDINTYFGAIDVGATEYINKPIKGDELEMLISKLTRENINRKRIIS